MRISPNYCAEKLKNPFFIIGPGRSGTTLLVHSLAKHKDVASYYNEANELWHPNTYPWHTSKYQDFVPPFWVDSKEFTNVSLKHLSPSQAEMIRSMFGAYQWIIGKHCFLNKSAMITFMIPFILEKFPDARFIHIIRDGRAVAFSYAKKQTEKIKSNIEAYDGKGYKLSFNKILMACAKNWKEHIEEVETQKRKLGLEARGIIFELRYEDFCLEPCRVLSQIASFMGIKTNGLQSKDFLNIKNANHKYREQLSKEAIYELTQIMEPSLKEKGYT